MRKFASSFLVGVFAVALLAGCNLRRNNVNTVILDPPPAVCGGGGNADGCGGGDAKILVKNAHDRLAQGLAIWARLDHVNLCETTDGATLDASSQLLHALPEHARELGRALVSERGDTVRDFFAAKADVLDLYALKEDLELNGQSVIAMTKLGPEPFTKADGTYESYVRVDNDAVLSLAPDLAGYLGHEWFHKVPTAIVSASNPSFLEDATMYEGVRGYEILHAAGGCLASVMRSYRGRVLADAPIAYWRMESIENAQLRDESGFSNNGELLGTINLETLGPLRPDKSHAIVFDRAPTKLSSALVPLPNSVDLASPDHITGEFWMKWDNTANTAFNAILSFDILGIAMVNGKIGLTATASEEVSGVTTTALQNQWHHIAFILDNRAARNFRIFIDGEPQPVTLHSYLKDTHTLRLAGAAAHRMVIGGRLNAAKTQTTFGFQGSLHGIVLYNKQLTPEQIRSHYNAGLNL